MKKVLSLLFILIVSFHVFGQPNYVVAHIPCSDADTTGIAVLIFYPDSARFDSCGSPVAIILPGGRAPMGIYTSYPALLPQYGVIEVFMNFPGVNNAGIFNSGGTYDLRGPHCVEALRAVTLFCMGMDTTTTGKYLNELLPVEANYNNVGYMGGSNGGNIALVSAGMNIQDFPGLKWITNWESPVGDGIMLADMGKENWGGVPFHNIAYNDTTGTFDYTKLRYSDTLYTQNQYPPFDTLAGFYFDNNNDGVPGDSLDFPLEPLIFGTGNNARANYSLSIIQQGYALGLIPSQKPYYIPTVQEAFDFWKWRNGIYWIDSLAMKRPDLMFIVTSKDHDHYLDTPDHPGVLKQYQRLMTVGLHLVRLNPDKSYMQYVLDSVYPGLPDNTCFTQYDHLTIRNEMEPDSIDQKFLYVAAILELVDRTQRHDYRTQLDSVYATCQLYVDDTHYTDSSNTDGMQVADTVGNLNSISETEINQNLFSIYPNPASQLLTIDNEQLIINKIEITDVIGKGILVFNPKPEIRNPKLNVDVSGLQSGIYFITIISENHTATRKFVVMH